MENTANVPDAIRQQAKEKALKVIQSTPGAISFVNVQELETQSLFVPVVTILKASADDFHTLGGGVRMPKSYYTNQIAEATGVNIIDVRVQKSGEFVWHGHAEGERRMPDGSMRKGSGEYEFDAEKRAEEDWLKDPGKYPNEIAKRRHVLEYGKFGMQRASSGARLALIRFLAGIPTGFTQENIQKAMIFCRIDRNVDGLLADPEMRKAAIDHALGVTPAIFGPKQIEGQPVARTVDEQTGEVIEPAAATPLFPDDDPAQPEPSPVDKLKAVLKEQLARIPADLAIKQGNVRELIQKTLDKANATEVECNAWIDRCNQYFQNVAAKGGAA